MSRAMWDATPELFRAVLVWRYDPGDGDPARDGVSHFGPYSTEATAKATLTRERRYRVRHHLSRVTIVDTRVERTVCTWEAV